LTATSRPSGSRAKCTWATDALATAAEIYANLETAVRAADDASREEVFAEFARQIGQLDRTAQRRCRELRESLGLDGVAHVAGTS
jgi:2-oxo-4-hydroxy-4-carboxy--5-ureidoimidazoline (OHCU) decarboxylase